jgi:VWFA-related protein
MPLRRWLLAAFAAVLPLSPAAAQEAPPPPAESGDVAASEFFESIEVNVVNVDVYVTDKKGNRVSGLAKSDFQLFEDGKPIEISNFYAVQEGRAATPTPAGTAPAPTSPGLPPELEVPDDQRLYLVVYIDNFNLKVFDRNRVFASLREFLRTKLSRHDRVMLITYDREAHIRRPFTSDPATIAAALFEIEKMSAMGNNAERERQDVLTEIKDAQDASYAVMRARSYAESVFNDLSFSLDSLKRLVSSLAGVPGRKAVLYVSSGLPLVAAEDIFHAIQDKWSNASSAMLESRNYDATRRYQEMIAQANANRISFYTIDAAGLRMSTSISAEHADPGASAFVDSVHFANLQGSLQLMAERTGGKAIYNTNDPARGLDLVASDFKTYYSLGYSPAHSGDGRYHKIEIRTKRKDLVVRHRDGYRDKTPEARMADGVMSSLYYDVESNPFGVTVERGPATPREDGNYVVTIEVKIPIGKLTLVPQGDLHAARVRVFLAAMDQKGGISEVQETRVPIEIPASDVAAAAGKTWVYSVQLLMRRGPQKLAVGVRDDIAAATSFAVRTLHVGT